MQRQQCTHMDGNGRCPWAALTKDGPALCTHHQRGCPFGDPTCPCQDGDVCHYRDDPVTGTKAMIPPPRRLHKATVY
jgi:hypothetical protein